MELLYQHESDKVTLEKPIIFLVISSLLGSFLLKFISSASIQSGIEYTAVVISILWVIGMSGCVWISFYIVRVKISYLFATVLNVLHRGGSEISRGTYTLYWIRIYNYHSPEYESYY